MLEMAQRAGMGGFFDFLDRPLGGNGTGIFSFGPPIDLEEDGGGVFTSPGPVYSPPVQSSGGVSIWQAQLPALAAGGLQVIRDIFAPPATSQAAYGAARPVYYPSTAAAAGLYPATVAATGVGIKVDSSGLWLGTSRISWVWIIGGIGILFLLQSPGFTRRRNPARRVNPKRRRKARARRR
jgi:hypothetical protein